MILFKIIVLLEQRIEKKKPSSRSLHLDKTGIPAFLYVWGYLGSGIIHQE